MLVYPVQAERWYIGGAAVDGERMSATEATCQLLWRIGMRHESLTTAQAARVIGYPVDSAYRLLCRMSRVVPLYQDDDDLWVMLEDQY